MKFNFYKISGSGNDFIIIDNRDNSVKLSRKQIEKICARRTGVGADGLIYLLKSDKYDFRMKFFNDDGKEADMCGNGGRSIVLFAYLKKIIRKKEVIFQSKKSIHKAFVKPNNVIKLQLAPPHSIKENMKVKIDNKVFTGTYMNTGVPHFVIQVKNIEKVNVFYYGRKIRYNKIFGKDGTNVDFIEKRGNIVHIRTYERGVENETLACGTGSVASAISLYLTNGEKSPIKLKTLSKEILTVYFNEDLSEIFFQGKVTPVYRGTILL